MVVLFFRFQPSENFELHEFEVRNSSMSGVFEPGENIEVDFEYFKRNAISRGDIVLFSYAGSDTYLLKTVYGIPGDIVDLKNTGKGFVLLINGREAMNSEGQNFSFSSDRARLLAQYIADYKHKIPAGAYLLLGNLSEGSVDSSQFGFVARENIVGRVVR